MQYIKKNDTIKLITDESKEELFQAFTEKRISEELSDLCDAFVLVCPDTHKKMRVLQSFYNTISLVKWDKKYPSHYEYVHKVYGAIWTDKGLIYVAKMNNKGELELI